jgi:hypothetical protein
LGKSVYCEDAFYFLFSQLQPICNRVGKATLVPVALQSPVQGTL